MEALMLSLLGYLLSLLLLYKYVALFLVGFVAALALPIPASTTLAAAGAFAAQGYFSLPYVLLTALAANILGDATGYLLARRYGVRVFHVLGLGSLLATPSYKKLQRYMQHFPHSVIFITRFLTEVGPATSILCGLSRVRYGTSFTFAVLGEVCYVLLYGLSGYYLGGEWENNLGFFVKAAMLIVSIGVFLNLVQYVLYKRRHPSGVTEAPVK